MGTTYKQGSLATTEIIENYNSTNSPGYPAFDNETLLGTVLLPKIYGKGLNALEIASSGSIILSVNDFETMDISSDGTKNTFQAKRGLELNFQPDDSDKTVHVGDHTWSSELFGTSNYQVMRTSNEDGYMLSNSLLVTSSATFKGDAHFEGDTFGVVSSNVDLTGSTHIEGTLRVTSNVTFDSDLEVLGDVNIIGNINVTGVVNTTSVTQLHAEDKIIQLSTHSNLDSQNENSVSDGAGVLIQGVLAQNIPMSGFDGRYDTLELLNSNNNKIIDKSLTWNNNGGVEKMGMLLYDPESDEPNLEPYWEMRGGGLRITQQVYNDAANAFVDVSFAFRINAREELEILKCVASNDTSDCRRVARFGAQGHLGRGVPLTRTLATWVTEPNQIRNMTRIDSNIDFDTDTGPINVEWQWNTQMDLFVLPVPESDPVFGSYKFLNNSHPAGSIVKGIKITIHDPQALIDESNGLDVEQYNIHFISAMTQNIWAAWNQDTQPQIYDPQSGTHIPASKVDSRYTNHVDFKDNQPTVHPWEHIYGKTRDDTDGLQTEFYIPMFVAEPSSEHPDHYPHSSVYLKKNFLHFPNLQLYNDQFGKGELNSAFELGMTPLGYKYWAGVNKMTPNVMEFFPTYDMGKLFPILHDEKDSYKTNVELNTIYYPVVNGVLTVKDFNILECEYRISIQKITKNNSVFLPGFVDENNGSLLNPMHSKIRFKPTPFITANPNEYPLDPVTKYLDSSNIYYSHYLKNGRPNALSDPTTQYGGVYDQDSHEHEPTGTVADPWVLRTNEYLRFGDSMYEDPKGNTRPNLFGLNHSQFNLQITEFVKSAFPEMLL
jgi:hypothetical protein